MDSSKLLKGLSFTSAGLGIIGGILGLVQTVDQMKNGVKLRDDQMLSMSRAIANNVSQNCMSMIHQDMQELYNQFPELRTEQK